MIPRRYVQNRLRHWGHAPFSKVVYDPLETRRYPHALLWRIWSLYQLR